MDKTLVLMKLVVLLFACCVSTVRCEASCASLREEFKTNNCICVNTVLAVSVSQICKQLDREYNSNGCCSEQTIETTRPNQTPMYTYPDESDASEYVVPLGFGGRRLSAQECARVDGVSGSTIATAAGCCCKEPCGFDKEETFWSFLPTNDYKPITRMKCKTTEACGFGFTVPILDWPVGDHMDYCIPAKASILKDDLDWDSAWNNKNKYADWKEWSEDAPVQKPQQFNTEGDNEKAGCFCKAYPFTPDSCETTPSMSKESKRGYYCKESADNQNPSEAFELFFDNTWFPEWRVGGTDATNNFIENAWDLIVNTGPILERCKQECEDDIHCVAITYFDNERRLNFEPSRPSRKCFKSMYSCTEVKGTTITRDSVGVDLDGTLETAQIYRKDPLSYKTGTCDTHWCGTYNILDNFLSYTDTCRQN